MSTPSRVNTVSLERKDITITMMMGVTPLTPVPRFFVLGDSNGDETRSRRIRPPIHHDPVSKMIQRIKHRSQDDPPVYAPSGRRVTAVSYRTYQEDPQQLRRDKRVNEGLRRTVEDSLGLNQIKPNPDSQVHWCLGLLS